MKRLLFLIPVLVACLSGAGTYVEPKLSSIQAIDKALHNREVREAMTLLERNTEPFTMFARIETEPSGTQTVEVIGGPPHTDSGIIMCKLVYDMDGNLISGPNCKAH